MTLVSTYYAQFCKLSFLDFVLSSTRWSNYLNQERQNIRYKAKSPKSIRPRPRRNSYFRIVKTFQADNEFQINLSQARSFIEVKVPLRILLLLTLLFFKSHVSQKKISNQLSRFKATRTASIYNIPNNYFSSLEAFSRCYFFLDIIMDCLMCLYLPPIKGDRHC